MTPRLLVALLALPAPALAQDEPSRAAPYGLGAADWSLTLLGQATGDGDISSTAEASFYRAGAALSMRAPLSQRWRLSASVEQEYTVYDFDGAAPVFSPAGGPQAFEELHRTALGATATFAPNQRWSFLVGGQAEFAAEHDAVYNDALLGRGFAGAMYAVSDNLRLGLGLVVSSRLEDNTAVFPVPMVEGAWNLSERATLAASTRDGLSFTWHATENLDVVASVSYRFHEYRLDSRDAAPSGVFEEFQIPLLVQANWRPWPRLTLSAGAGALLYQNYRVSDSSGTELAEADADPAPFAQASLVFRF